MVDLIHTQRTLYTRATYYTKLDLWHEKIEKLSPHEQVYSIITGVIFSPMIIGLQIGYKLMRREK